VQVLAGETEGGGNERRARPAVGAEAPAVVIDLGVEFAWAPAVQHLTQLAFGDAHVIG
jgi:hypothetical protein